MNAPSKIDPQSQEFGYVCRACSRCCHHKDIQVNPYELARLARRLGQTTTAFRDAYTRDAGTRLRHTDSGACVFLGDQGCEVYPDRPLVCRLYPLGRRLTPEGVETFVQLEGHPDSAGEFTNKGTIKDFLDSQDAAPFIKAADEYYRWYCAAHGIVSGTDLVEAVSGDIDLAAVNIVDMDHIISEHCAMTGRAAPANIEERKQLHLTLLNEKLADYVRRTT